MPYADPEKRRAVNREHYAANKWHYNPGREKCRAAAIKLKGRIVSTSMDRFVSPAEIQELCMTHDSCPTPAQVAWMFKRITQGIPGSAEGGVFLGRSPFCCAPQYGLKREIVEDVIARDRFLEQYPRLLKRKKQQPLVELLVLNLMLWRAKLYGKY